MRSPTISGKPASSRGSDLISESVGGWENASSPTTSADRADAGRMVDGLIDGRSGVLAGHAVDLHPAPASIGGIGRHQLAHGLPPADHLDGIPDFQAERRDVRRIEPREPLAKITGDAPR